MKSFILAATVAAGFVCSGSTADAQILRRNRSYDTASYSPAYGTSYYTAPSSGAG